MRPARISPTLSHHVSLSFIASGRSSGLHPVSSHSCCMYVRAGRPAFDCPYAGVHRITLLTSSSLLLQQCSACLVRLAWIVFVIGGRWQYSWCLVGCCYIASVIYIFSCHINVNHQNATDSGEIFIRALKMQVENKTIPIQILIESSFCG